MTRLNSSVQYVMYQIDTIALIQNYMHSPITKVDTLTSVGGVLEFDPGFAYQDSVVYYWEVSRVPIPGGIYKWNEFSFIYIDPARSTVGFNQSHYFQHQSSTADSIVLAPNRQWTSPFCQHP